MELCAVGAAGLGDPPEGIEGLAVGQEKYDADVDQTEEVGQKKGGQYCDLFEVGLMAWLS